MLVLMRDADNGSKSVIAIGDNIRVIILEVIGNKVRVGIEAPKDVAILREEIVERNHFRERSGNR